MTSTPSFPLLTDPTRRSALTGLFLAGSGLLTGCASEPPSYAAGQDAEREAQLPSSAPTLYVVASNACPTCTYFERAYFPRFKESVERQKVRLIVLHSPTRELSYQLNPDWVGNHRWILDEAYKHQLLMATPLFVLTRENKYLMAGYGIEDWNTDIVPAIRKEVGLARQPEPGSWWCSGSLDVR